MTSKMTEKSINHAWLKSTNQNIETKKCCEVLFKYNNTYQKEQKHYAQQRFAAIGVLGEL